MPSLPNIIGLLGKVKFIFYPNPDRPGIGIPYQPVFNPTEFSVGYKNSYDEGEQVNSGDSDKKFLKLNPRTVSMELFFDGTGASPSNSLLNSVGLGGVNTVDLQIETFFGLAYNIQKDGHHPNFLTLVWGSFIMNGVLTSADVSYTMFEPDGRPLRATMKIEIEETIASTLLSKLLNLLSPDLSKSIVVKEGDTLPLLCHQEYNDASLYPKIAEVNNLKNYRKLKQGMELLFPPIDNLA